MKNFLRKSAFRFTCKKINEKKLDVIHIALKSDELSYFNLSSNPVVSFTYGGVLYYFRECPMLRRQRDYYGAAIDDFFQSLSRLGISKEHFKQEIPIRINFSKEEILHFKEYLDTKKADKSFIKVLSKADTVSQKCGFSIWEKQEYGSSFFGEFGMADLDMDMSDIAVYFLWYMRSAAAGYKMQRIAKGKHYSFFNAVRAMASRIVAEELHLGQMISDVRFCLLKLDDGRELFGTLSRGANGTRMADSFVLPNGSLQKELLNLNALDVICRQVDHGPNNYNVFKKDGMYFVCAFDNDNQQTFFPLSSVRVSLAGCAPLVDKNGMVARHCFDKSTAEKIQTVNIKALKKRLKPYLNFLQIRATVSRIKKLQKALKKSRCFMLNPDEFSETTANDELNGAYGRTYLTRALENKGEEREI